MRKTFTIVALLFCHLISSEVRADGEKPLNLRKPVRKASVCAGILMGLRFYHSIPTLSSQHTEKAYSALQDFRIKQIKERGTQPKLKPVVAYSIGDQVSGSTEDVAERIKGLEFHYNLEGDHQRVFAGAVTPKRENIEEFKAKLLSTMAEYRDLPRSMGTTWQIIDGIQKFMWANTYSVGLYVPINTAIDLAQGTRSPLAAINPITLYFAYVGLVDLPQHLYYRSTRVWEKNFQSKIDLIDKFLNTSGKDDWLYLSGDKDLVPELVDEIWNTGALTPGRISYQGTYEAQLNMYRQMHKNKRFIQYDLLFVRDQETGEPKMISFIRFHRDRPHLPPPPKTKKSANEILDSVKGAIGIGQPVGQPSMAGP